MQQLSLSDEGLVFIARQEGFRSMAYDDAAGNRTIGYGHRLEKDERYPDGITAKAALDLLAGDISDAEAAVTKGITAILSQPQFDALVSFAYNAGAGAFARSTLLRYVNAGKWEQAGDELLRWDKITQQGVLLREPGLARRREAERTLFLTGDYTG